MEALITGFFFFFFGRKKRHKFNIVRMFGVKLLVLLLQTVNFSETFNFNTIESRN